MIKNLQSENMFLTSKNIWSSYDGKLQWAQCVFSKEHYHPGLFKDLNIERPLTIEKSTIKRQAEFLAGRYAAKLALEKCQYTSNTPLSIPIGKHREPIWPAGYIGSISHCTGIALCASALKNEIHYLGIDIEPYIPEPLAVKIASQIHTDHEQHLLRKIGLSYSQITTLLYSAKESFFKAIYPRVGEYFGFESISLTAINMDENKLIFEVKDFFYQRYLLESRYECQFQLCPLYVITLVTSQISAVATSEEGGRK